MMIFEGYGIRIWGAPLRTKCIIRCFSERLIVQLHHIGLENNVLRCALFTARGGEGYKPSEACKWLGRVVLTLDSGRSAKDSECNRVLTKG